MAKPLRPLTSLQGLVDAPARRRMALRWPLIGCGAVVALVVLAWIDGGEQAMRPIAEQIELPEQPQ